MLGKSGEIDVDMFEAERLALLHRGVSRVVISTQWCSTYNNEHRSCFFILLAAAEEGLDLAPEVVHLCVFVMVEGVVKSVGPKSRKNYVRSRKVSVFANAEKLSLMDRVLETNCRDLVEER